MTAEQLNDYLVTLKSVFTECVKIITQNPILMTMFVASLVLVGFKIFKRAKSAAKS